MCYNPACLVLELLCECISFSVPLLPPPQSVTFTPFQTKLSQTGFLSCLHFFIVRHFSLTLCHLPAAPHPSPRCSSFSASGCVSLWPGAIAPAPLSPPLSVDSVPHQLSHVSKAPPLAARAIPKACGSQPLFLISLLSLLGWSPYPSPQIQGVSKGTCHWDQSFQNIFYSHRYFTLLLHMQIWYFL